MHQTAFHLKENSHLINDAGLVDAFLRNTNNTSVRLKVLSLFLSVMQETVTVLIKLPLIRYYCSKLNINVYTIEITLKLKRTIFLGACGLFVVRILVISSCSSC